MTRNILRAGVVLLPVLTICTHLAAEETDSVPTVSISQEECAMLAKQAARQSATYVPGMSVTGKKVVSANVDSNANDYLPDTYVIPLTASLANLIGLNASQKAFLGEGVSLGSVTVSRGGTVKLNGKRIGGPSDSAELWQALCR